MTYVWVYSLASESPSPFTSISFSEYATGEIVDALQQQIKQKECSVKTWRPFHSNHENRGYRQFLVLLVHDWRKITKRDYFVAANALALQESGSVRLLPALFDRFDTGMSNDLWAERYRLTRKRLEEIAVVGPCSGTTQEWSKELAFRVKRLILDTSDVPTLHYLFSSAAATRPTRVFFSYSHRDEALLDELAHHLKLLERMGLIQHWHDRKIRAGDTWVDEIDVHLHTADLILLLLSSDFFASDYCSEMEAPIALERHNAKAARAIPVVLRPVVWKHSPLAALQSLPTDGRPVTSWDSHDSAFVNVCEGILGSALATKVPAALERPLPPRQYSVRKRFVDAAMPGKVEIDRSVMVVVLVRKPSSAGLRDLFAGDISYGVQPEDVRAKPVSLEFPVGDARKPLAINLAVLLKAPDFDPPEQKRTLTLQPDENSQPLIFMVAARRSGELKAVVEIHHHELVTSFALSTLAREGEALEPGAPSIVSTTFEIEEGVHSPQTTTSDDPPQLARQQADLVSKRIEAAESLLRAGDYERALKTVNEALAINPEEWQARYLQAFLQSLQHQKKIQGDRVRPATEFDKPHPSAPSARPETQADSHPPAEEPGHQSGEFTKLFGSTPSRARSSSAEAPAPPPSEGPSDYTRVALPRRRQQTAPTAPAGEPQSASYTFSTKRVPQLKARVLPARKRSKYLSLTMLVCGLLIVALIVLLVLR